MPKAKEQPIRGDIIKKSFDELNVLGQALKEAIIEHIERNDVILDDKHHYTLQEIEKLLHSIFGSDATRLLVQRLRRGVDASKQE